jgi:hypothetical protein
VYSEKMRVLANPPAKGIRQRKRKLFKRDSEGNRHNRVPTAPPKPILPEILMPGGEASDDWMEEIGS